MQQISRFVFRVTMLLTFSPVALLSQSGTTTLGENQRLGTLMGTVSIDGKSQPRSVFFVGFARKTDRKKNTGLAVGIGNGKSNLKAEEKPLLSLLTLMEAKQSSKVLQHMSDLANRNKSLDNANKSLSYRTASGFSLRYDEFNSGQVFTISAGESGGRICQFQEVESILLAKGCLDDSITWMESRFKPLSKSRFGSAYKPKTLEEKAVVSAFRKSMGKSAALQKILSLEVEEDWAHGGCVDVKEQTDGEQFVACKIKGAWKIVARGSSIVEDLADAHVIVPARLRKKWWSD